MGTQQILLIVLSVIIVGAAIAAGITMFNNQSYATNKAAIAVDAQNFATQVVQYYKTPASQGGADRLRENMTAKKIGDFIGWQGTTTTNENGTFTIGDVGTTDTLVTITGIGKEVKNRKNPKIETKVGFPSGYITATASDVAVTP